ncbi:MAG: hypothetical protein II842_07420 [Butyrivibrio sp.]|nr:hypothetical protein [Butyrivibrio sp.]
MDKVEYKIRADEIKALIGEGRYAEAVKIADTIDWKRVKSVSMLCTISDLYKINRRYEESRDVLLMAYDKHPTGRLIVYSLCELAIKMGEFVQAVEYYKEFVRIAPRDPGRYILQYKLYEAQEVSLEERIAVLEELKKHDYRERWAYELAYLYHRVGLTTECIEECDEMFLWFGEGRYVMKALELKALHEPLSPEQQDRYNRYKNKNGIVDDSASKAQEAANQEPVVLESVSGSRQPTKEMPPITDEVIKAYNEGQPLPVEETLPEESVVQETVANEPNPEEIVYPHINEIKEPSVDVSAYNTMNLQETLAAGLREIIASENVSEDTKIFDPAEVKVAAEEVATTDADTQPSLYDTQEGLFGQKTGEIKQPTGNMQELFFDTQSVEIPSAPQMGIDIKYGGNGPILGEAKEDKPEPDVELEELDEEIENAGSEANEEVIEETEGNSEEATQEEIPEETSEEEPSLEKPEKDYSIKSEYKPAFGIGVYEEKPLEDEVPGAVIHPNASYQMPSHFESILSQESDGQISMAVSPEPQVEKQITGQISISDYMLDWENYKKSQQEKQLQSVKKRVADETGDMFADFDEKTKAGLQEKIEKAISEAIKKEQYEKASGRADWTVKREDVISAAIDEVVETHEKSADIDAEDVETVQEVSTDTQEISAEQITETQEAVDELAEEISEAIEQESEVEAAKEEEIPETEDKAEASEAIEESALEAASSEADAEYEVPEEPAKEQKPEEENEANREATLKEKKIPTEDSGKKDANSAHNKEKRHIGNREIEERVRTMTPEEKELFGPYIHHKKSRRQIINAIDNLSMDAFSGNAIVTGEEGAGTVNLAKGLIKAMQASDSNFSGKVAKITANTLNKKSTAGIFEKLANGALIIQRAADLDTETVGELLGILQEENKGLVIVMEDTRDDMDKFLEKNPSLKQSFNVRVDIEALDDDSLVAYAKQYAFEKEYAIDNLGILALHTRISERQTLDHEVTVAEVKDIVDDAIYYAEKRSIGHFVDVIVNKRYDENDMVILREKDFMH